MKKTTILILSILIVTCVSAQEKSSFIGIQLGPSFPVGGFHTKQLPEGGFALTGLNTELEGAWFFRSWVGVGASFCMNLHPVDAGTLGNEKLKENEFLTSLIIRSNPYLSLALYPGLYFKFPVAPKFYITAKAAGGLMYAQTPYQLYKAEYYMIGKNWYEVTSAGDYEWSFLAGAGLRYDLNDLIGFTLQGDFTYNVMDFTFISSGGTERTDEKVLSFVNLTGGIVFKIGKR
jgi:hypothetical protein